MASPGEDNTGCRGPRVSDTTAPAPRGLRVSDATSPAPRGLPVSAADPLNLEGILTPEPRIPAQARRRVVVG